METQGTLEASQIQELHHQQAAKQAQKDRVRQFLSQVDQALAEGDQHVAFKTSQLLRPWRPARRAQLKSDTGHIVSPADELTKLRQYAEGHFCGSRSPCSSACGPLPTQRSADLALHIHSIISLAKPCPSSCPRRLVGGHNHAALGQRPNHKGHVPRRLGRVAFTSHATLFSQTTEAKAGGA